MTVSTIAGCGMPQEDAALKSSKLPVILHKSFNHDDADEKFGSVSPAKMSAEFLQRGLDNNTSKLCVFF